MAYPALLLLTLIAIAPCSMMMRNVASQSYGWDHFCADPASFVDECLADPACSKCVLHTVVCSWV